jgi:hypothetical protein
MSRFFRSQDSSSSESSISENASDDHSGLVEPVHATNPPSGDTRLHVLALPGPVSHNEHRDYLLHALLEERCLREVQSEHTGRSARDVAAEANRRYQQLCAHLASYNLISTGLEGDQYTRTRQRYRDGLDFLSSQRGLSTATATVPPVFRRLLTDGTSPLDNRDTDVPFPLRRLLTGPENVGANSSLQPRSLLESRYQQEYVFPLLRLRVVYAATISTVAMSCLFLHNLLTVV